MLYITFIWIQFQINEIIQAIQAQTSSPQSLLVLKSSFIQSIHTSSFIFMHLLGLWNPNKVQCTTCFSDNRWITYFAGGGTRCKGGERRAAATTCGVRLTPITRIALYILFVVVIQFISKNIIQHIDKIEM